MAENWRNIRAARHRADPALEGKVARARAAADFGAAVYALRKAAGLTQAELAVRMGTTQSAIARLEGGDRMPTMDVLRRVAEAVEGHVTVTMTTDRQRLDIAIA